MYVAICTLIAESSCKFAYNSVNILLKRHNSIELCISLRKKMLFIFCYEKYFTMKIYVIQEPYLPTD